MRFSIKKALVSYCVHNYKTLRLVERALAKNRIDFKCVNREMLTKNQIRNKDLIISVGGDGTFLRTAHLVDKTPVFVVSSDVNYNEAFYGRATIKDFERKIKLILNGKSKITKLPRLEARINKKKVPMLAVNEVFVGSRHPYHTSRYILKVKGKSELQKSSGVLVTTRTGSSGWAKSAAKKKLSIPKTGFGFVVREPYIGRLTKSKLLLGSLSAKETLRITSLNHQGVVVVDSSEKEFGFVDGDKLEVKVSKKPLNFVEF
ncbi:NAD(+)/NADH kinase [Candidatus Woesearchaeota archaeon]|nr:NAD(+)/NADH kinase [Candidatus Woesearchaeota archaeon]